MSFLTERLIRSAFPMGRQFVVQAPRAFSTSVVMRKNATETVKDGLKTVDRTVTDNVVLPTLETAASVGSKAKEGVESVIQGKKGKVEELKGQAKGTAEQMKGQAQGTAEQLKGQAKGAAADAQAKAEEMKNKL